MAKAGIHPDYHEITIVMTDGTSYKTRSCLGKAGDTLQLDVDPSNHAAWVGGVNLRKTGRLERFGARFGNIGAMAGQEEKKDDKASA